MHFPPNPQVTKGLLKTAYFLLGWNLAKQCMKSLQMLELLLALLWSGQHRNVADSRRRGKYLERARMQLVIEITP